MIDDAFFDAFLQDLFQPEGSEERKRALSQLKMMQVALRAVRLRRDRINGALGYEFIGEYIDKIFR